MPAPSSEVSHYTTSQPRSTSGSFSCLLVSDTKQTCPGSAPADPNRPSLSPFLLQLPPWATGASNTFIRALPVEIS